MLVQQTVDLGPVDPVLVTTTRRWGSSTHVEYKQRISLEDATTDTHFVRNRYGQNPYSAKKVDRSAHNRKRGIEPLDGRLAEQFSRSEDCEAYATDDDYNAYATELAELIKRLGNLELFTKRGMNDEELELTDKSNANSLLGRGVVFKLMAAWKKSSFLFFGHSLSDYEETDDDDDIEFYLMVPITAKELFWRRLICHLSFALISAFMLYTHCTHWILAYKLQKFAKENQRREVAEAVAEAEVATPTVC